MLKVKVLLGTVHEVYSEKLTTGDQFAVRTSNDIVPDVGANCLHHPLAKSGVYPRPCGLVGRVLENKFGDADERPTIFLRFGLVGPRYDLVGNSVEIHHRELVEESPNLFLNVLLSVSLLAVITPFAREVAARGREALPEWIGEVETNDIQKDAGILGTDRGKLEKEFPVISDERSAYTGRNQWSRSISPELSLP